MSSPIIISTISIYAWHLLKHSIVGDVGLHFGGLRFLSLSLIVPKIIYYSLEKVWLITNWLKITYNKQKSYADNSRKYLEYEVGDIVYLKISPIKGMMIFCKNRKLIRRYP